MLHALDHMIGTAGSAATQDSKTWSRAFFRRFSKCPTGEHIASAKLVLDRRTVLPVLSFVRPRFSFMIAVMDIDESENGLTVLGFVIWTNGFIPEELEPYPWVRISGLDIASKQARTIEVLLQS